MTEKCEADLTKFEKAKLKANFLATRDKERMLSKGWTLLEEIDENILYDETKKVKIYYVSSHTRGIHKYVAMVK